MSETLVDRLSDYRNSISPGSPPSDEAEIITERRQQNSRAPVTALTLPEPLKPSDYETSKYLENEKDATTAANALTTAAHKLNTGIVYRDYISDSSDLNSDTSSVEDQYQRHQFRQSTGDLTLISKAVSVDTHNSSDMSSAVVPAERNPVSGLLQSPASSIESAEDDEATSEYFSADSLPARSNTRQRTTSSGSIHRTEERVVSTTANNEPPPPPSNSSLKKILLHYDHKIIPDEKEQKQEQRELRNSAPTAQPNVESRFITMEEELEVNGAMYMPNVEDQEAEERLPNNLSMMDLSLPVKETLRKQEIRSLEQRRSIKRLNAIKELMETEETYSRDLSILCTHFFAIIKEAPCILAEEADILVRNAMDIYAFQERFTEALIDAHGDEEEEKNGIFYKGNLKNIATCFVEWGPKFEIYLDYCVRQDHAVSVYNELLQTNPEFSNLIERLHTFHRVSFGFSRLKFDDYLIIPFQRIFRYRLLLQSITKATQKDSEEYEILSQAQNTIHIIATRINNEKSKMEAKRKTSLFLSRLDSDWCLPKRWFNTLGVCNLIGTLEVRCIEDSKAKRIGCALFNHYMIMAKAKKHKSYEPRHWFPLRKFDIENLPNAEGSLMYSWLLRSDEHTLELSAICELEKQIWMEQLSMAIRESKELYSSSFDSNEYLLEQLFVSSFDQHVQPKCSSDKAIESESPIHFPMPSGSNSFSQSAIFNKPAKSNNRVSQPVFGTHEHSHADASLLNTSGNGGSSSPGLRSQSSISDLRDFFASNVSEKWSQRKFNQYYTRCKSVDTKFDDVCTTPILTARANSMNRNGSRRKMIPHQANSSNISLAKSFVLDSSIEASPIVHSPSIISGHSPMNSLPNSRRPSTASTRNTDSMIFRLAQRNANMERSNSIKSNTPQIISASESTCTIAAGLPSVANTPSTRKFFGKMVEKLGQIGTPRSRRNHAMMTVPPTSKLTLSLKPPTLLVDNSQLSDHLQQSTPTTTKKKFFPQFLQARHNNLKK